MDTQLTVVRCEIQRLRPCVCVVQHFVRNKVHAPRNHGPSVLSCSRAVHMPSRVAQKSVWRGHCFFCSPLCICRRTCCKVGGKSKARTESGWPTYVMRWILRPRLFSYTFLHQPPSTTTVHSPNLTTNTLFGRCADAPPALGQRCHLAHQKYHGLTLHCRPLLRHWS